MRFVLWLMFGLLAFATPAHADDPCTAMGVALWATDPHTLTDARGIRIFKDVYARAHIPRRIYLCEFIHGIPSPFVLKSQIEGRDEERIGILLPKGFLNDATDEVLRGAFAHELGHVHLWDSAVQKAMLDSGASLDHLSVEMEADAFGAKLVGARAVIETLKMVEPRVLKTLAYADKILIETEIPLRLKALLALPSDAK